MTTDKAFEEFIEERRMHKAVDGTDPGHCAICGQRIKSVPGGQGPTWVHQDSGAVAAPNPPGVSTENNGRLKDRPLNEIMEFDHVVRVYKDGQITSVPNVFAPELYDEELQSADRPWQLMNGYSGQDRYRGPVMHNSEFIGGGMERDIRETPGLYVAVVANWTQPDDDDTDPDEYDGIEGWVVAYIHDEVAE